jgi:hypothetical protein
MTQPNRQKLDTFFRSETLQVNEVLTSESDAMNKQAKILSKKHDRRVSIVATCIDNVLVIFVSPVIPISHQRDGKQQQRHNCHCRLQKSTIYCPGSIGHLSPDSGTVSSGESALVDNVGCWQKATHNLSS